MMVEAEQIRTEVVHALRTRAIPMLSEASNVEKCVISWAPRMDKCAGKAYYSASRGHRVRLSKPIYSLEENQFDFRDTVLHELAHVACVGHKHDLFWKRTFMYLGGSGKQRHNLKTLPYRKNAKVMCRCNECGRQKLLGPAQAWAAQKGKRDYHCLAVVNNEEYDLAGTRMSFQKYCNGKLEPPYGWTYGAMNAARKSGGK